MTRRMLLLALSLSVLTTSLTPPTPPTAKSTCEECAAYCNMIPMDPTECLNLYCPGCADAGSDVGAQPVG
jgi:hypothetical protein